MTDPSVGQAGPPVPQLQFPVTTGRHPGFESLEEVRLLLALDLAGDLADVQATTVTERHTSRRLPGMSDANVEVARPPVL